MSRFKTTTKIPVQTSQVAKGSLAAAAPQENFLLNFFLGGISATIAKTSVAPTERVKLILQTQSSKGSLMTKRYSGITDCLKNVVENEGFKSLWKGNGINVIKIFPMNALNLALKDLFGKWIYVKNPEQNKMKFLGASVLSGGLAGACAITTIFPLDFARTRLSVDINSGGKRQFKGFFDCLSKVLKQDGIRGCYNGISMAITGMFLSRGLTLGLYDFVKTFALKDPANTSLLTKFLIANAVTQTVNICLYPLDTVGRSLMMQSGSKTKLYKNPIDCGVKLFRKHGLKGFYKGALSDAITGLGSSLVLVLYDDLKRLALNMNKKPNY